MGRTVIVTGADGGMGSQAVDQLLRSRCSVIMACRTPWKAELLRNSLQEKYPYGSLRLLKLDLCSPSSISEFVEDVRALGVTVDALFNNAGVLAHGFSETEDGYESTVATNLIGPARLIHALLTTGPESDSGRKDAGGTLFGEPPHQKTGLFAPNAQIINMVSLACYTGKIEDDYFTHREKKFHQIWRYSDSKLGFMLYSLELQKRLPEMGYPGICVDVADPGIVNTEMIRLGKWFDPLTDLVFRPVCNSPLRGATPALRALGAAPDASGAPAAQPASPHTVRYFVGKGFKPVPKRYVEHPRREWLYDELIKRL